MRVQSDMFRLRGPCDGMQVPFTVFHCMGEIEAFVPPLRIVVLFHPQSAAARQLALGIYRRFMALGGGPGLRIPVAFGASRSDGAPPPAPTLDSQTHTLVVALVDARMARRALPEDRVVADAWGDRIYQCVTSIGAAPGAHAVLPIALDAGAFGLDRRLEDRSFVRLDVLADPTARQSELELQVAIAASQLVQHGTAVSEPQRVAPITLFVSHAKVDAPHVDGDIAEGPVEELLAYLAQNPVEGWFDRKRIPGATRFDEAIESGVKKSDVVVCVVTDHYSDREWCRREAIFAKRLDRPLVVVDALTERSERLFPFLGNVPTLRWKPGGAKTVVLAALLETLRRCPAHAVLMRRKQPDDKVFSAHPESLTLRGLEPTVRRVLYPDPPLPREELDALEPVYAIDNGDRLRRVELATPLSKLARWDRPPNLDMVGLSLSTATDIDAWGASPEHLATLAMDLSTMLLVAGLRLGYGGAIEHGGVATDNVNYAARLFALVRSYSPLASTLGATRFHPIQNYVAWPKYLPYGDAELAMYGQEAELVRCPRPPIAVTDAELGVMADGRIPFDTPTQRWAYARGLTVMRMHMTQAIGARVALAGKLEGYKGVLPGVIEEIILARLGQHRCPVYLLGAFGGAVRLVIDLIEQRPREQATTGWVSANVAGYAELVAEYRQRGDGLVTPEEVADALRQLGRDGPARALDNGLDDAENRQLFDATDSHRIVELILTGLRRRFAAPGT